MAPASRSHDPFNDAPPRRPTSRTATHLQQDAYTSSGHALRSTTTSSRNLFATSLSRQPIATTAASSTHINDVLEDSDHGDDRPIRRVAGVAATRPRTRRARAATETAVEPDEDEKRSGDLVVRDKSGNYVHQVPMVGEPEYGIEEEQRAEDARLTSIARDYWISGGGLSARGSRKIDDVEGGLKPKTEIMTRLRTAVDRKLTEEKWIYEPTDYLEELRIRNHGV